MGLTMPRTVASSLRCAGVVSMLSFAALASAQQVAVVSQGASNPAHRSVLINMVSHVKARPDFAGEACAAMYLERLGTGMDQDFVFDQSGVNPADGRGCNIAELKLALERIGFLVGQVWYPISRARPAADLDQQFDALHADLDSGVPTIVHMRDSDKHDASKRFRLVLGYDADSDEILYHEPLEKEGSFKRMNRETLLKLWPLKSGSDTTVARMPLKHDEKLSFVDVASGQDLLTDADYAQHVRKLKPLLPEGYHVFVQRPFVIVGNDIEGVVRTQANETVKWAVDRLKLMYFEKDPDHIIIVWLLKDAKSYSDIITRFYKHQPASPFGYYSPAHKAIFANMSFGTGTLVHEIVHPFMLANFPKCPSWFNEGLASLYEQSNDRDGRMRAQTNQRLGELHKAIMARQVKPIETLTAASREEFYGGDRLMNYAQARYLCYYLEKNDLLEAYYHQFRSNVDKDPTGFATLQKVLGADGQDMGKFQRKWENWLLTKRY